MGIKTNFIARWLTLTPKHKSQIEIKVLESKYHLLKISFYKVVEIYWMH